MSNTRRNMAWYTS